MSDTPTPPSLPSLVDSSSDEAPNFCEGEEEEDDDSDEELDWLALFALARGKGKGKGKDKGKSTNIAKDKDIDKDKGKDTDKDDAAGEEPQPMAQDVTCPWLCVSCERRCAKAYGHQGYHLCHAHSGTWVSNDGVQAE